MPEISDEIYRICVKRELNKTEYEKLWEYFKEMQTQ